VGSEATLVNPNAQHAVEFAVHEEIWRWFPGMTIVVVAAAGLDIAGGQVAETDLWTRAWHTACARSANLPSPQADPRIRAWRDRMAAVGVSPRKYPSSIEALFRRASKGGEPFTVNPLVDAYNAVSLDHLVPIGGFDADELTNGLQLRMTRQGDRFRALDEEAATDVPPGEVCYSTGNEVLTRHFVWRQSRRGLIQPRTERAILLSEILDEASTLEPGLADRVSAELEEVARSFATIVSLSILDPSAPSAVLLTNNGPHTRSDSTGTAK
jgi:DNA/RNA-binding domain of Phe-tRNA-synthetase-like protein